jgi:hypothetical protein
VIIRNFLRCRCYRLGLCLSIERQGEGSVLLFRAKWRIWGTRELLKAGRGVIARAGWMFQRFSNSETSPDYLVVQSKRDHRGERSVQFQPLLTLSGINPLPFVLPFILDTALARSWNSFTRSQIELKVFGSSSTDL